MSRDIVRRFEDLAEQSWQKNRGVDSDFLTPEEYAVYEAHAGEWAYANPRIYEPDWERKLIHFGPGEADLALLEIRSCGGRFVRVEHRDFLGAILSTGLDRRCLGDLVVVGERAFLHAKRTAVDFLTRELTRVGRARVEVVPLEHWPAEARPVWEEETLVVSSLRLDRLVATAFRLGRGKAAEAIAEGRVLIDGRPTLRAETSVKDGERITLRRGGKIRYLGVQGTTKKGSHLVRIARYGTAEGNTASAKGGHDHIK